MLGEDAAIVQIRGIHDDGLLENRHAGFLVTAQRPSEMRGGDSEGRVCRVTRTNENQCRDPRFASHHSRRLILSICLIQSIRGQPIPDEGMPLARRRSQVRRAGSIVALALCVFWVGHQLVAETAAGWIAFHSTRDGNREIYVMREDGSDLRNITHHPSNDRLAAWSPDGRSLAFESYRDGNFEIYVVDISSREMSQLTHDEAEDSWAEWSPDGEWIAFMSNRHGKFGIYAIRPDGSDLHRITPPGVECFQPSFSPNGTQLAIGATVDGNDDIWIIDWQGNFLQRVTEHPAVDWAPAWSPDGRSIAFTTNRSGLRASIWVVNVDGTDLRCVVDLPGLVGRQYSNCVRDRRRRRRGDLHDPHRRD